MIPYLKLNPHKWKTWFKIRICRKEKNKEYGTRQRKTISGKKMFKIKCLSNKKVKKPTINGKRNRNYPSLKSEKLKTNVRQTSPSKTGFKEENSDMDGKTLNNLHLKEIQA